MNPLVLILGMIGAAVGMGIAKKLTSENENLTPTQKESKTIDEDAKSIPPLIVETPETELTGPHKTTGETEQ